MTKTDCSKSYKYIIPLNLLSHWMIHLNKNKVDSRLIIFRISQDNPLMEYP